MSTTTVRLHYIDADGCIQDARRSFPLSTFAGFLPVVGDQFLLPPRDPGALPSPEGRKLVTVVGRVFNPRDLDSFVALICSPRDAGVAEASLLPDIDAE